MESRLSSAALIGITIERNTVIKIRKLNPITIRKKIGIRSVIFSSTSTNAAVAPPTYTVVSGVTVVAGITSSRRRLTSFVVSASCGDVLGVIWIIAVSPASLTIGGETATT